MRIPLTPHGTRELLLYGSACALLAAGAWLLHPWAAAVPLVLLVFVAAFFRDPERHPEGGPETAVAPADGKVWDIEEVDEPHFLGGRALRIGIFLSVFDVHVNRAPLDGRLTGVRYTKGSFHDVRDERAKTENEANLAAFEGGRGPFVVNQIAGLVARRIVFPFREGDELARGQRMGMIKFGSRTELYVPAGTPVRVEVAVGQRVEGGRTPILTYLDGPAAADAAPEESA